MVGRQSTATGTKAEEESENVVRMSLYP